MGRPRKRKANNVEDSNGDVEKGDSSSAILNSYISAPTVCVLHNEQRVPGFDNATSIGLADELLRKHAPRQSRHLPYDGTISCSQLQTSSPSLRRLPATQCTTNSCRGELIDQSQTCACLSTIYLELSDLQLMREFAFPSALGLLQKAMNVAYYAIKCPVCPRDAFTAQQNLHLNITLLSSVAERFKKIVNAIRHDAAQLFEKDEIRNFQFCEASKCTYTASHITPDTSPTFDIELHATEWQQMALKVVKANCISSENRSVANITLQDLISQMEARQTHWHADKNMVKRLSELYPECFATSPVNDFLCMRMLRSVRTIAHQIIIS